MTRHVDHVIGSAGDVKIAFLINVATVPGVVVTRIFCEISLDKSGVMIPYRG